MCHLLLSVVCSCPSCIVKLFSVAGLVFGDGWSGGLAVERQWAVNGGGVMLVVWVCPVMAGGGHWWFLWMLVVICRLLYHLGVFVAIVRQLWGWLLSFLDSWDHLSRWVLYNLTWGWRGSEADVGCHWVVYWVCGQHHYCWHGGCWLKKPHHKDVTLPWCSTCMWDHKIVVSYLALFQTSGIGTCHPNLSICLHPSNPLQAFDRKIDQMYA